MSLLVLSISRPLLAQASLCQTKTVVYFGNGIGSGIATAVNAGISLKSLKNEVNKTLPVDEQSKFEYALAFNSSGGAALDFKEVCQQIFGNEYLTVARGTYHPLPNLPPGSYPARAAQGTPQSIMAALPFHSAAERR